MMKFDGKLCAAALLLAAVTATMAAQSTTQSASQNTTQAGSQSTTQGRSDARITRGPMIQYADDQLAVVTWTTAAPRESRVLYGTEEENLTHVAEGTGQLATNHRVNLVNLEPNATYYFEIDNEGVGAPQMFTFRTAATGGRPVQNVAATLHSGDGAMQDQLQAAQYTVTRGPTIQYADEAMAVITWMTAEPGASALQYGRSQNELSQLADMGGDSINHRVQVSGLAPNSTYYFQVGDGMRFTPQVYSLVTAARGGQATYDRQAMAVARGATTARTTDDGGFSQRTSQPPAGRGLAVAAGSEIMASLETALSSKTASEGQRFTAVVREEVRDNQGRVAIPIGARISGEVTDVESGKTLPTVRGRGKLNLRFREVTLPDGSAMPLTATLVSVHEQNKAEGRRTGEEGEVESRTDGGRAARNVGIGAAIGTLGGLIFGSALKGLLIGAVAGGGYVLATQGKDVELPADTGLRIRLDQNLVVPYRR